MSTYIFALIGIFTATSWFMRFLAWMEGEQ